MIAPNTTPRHMNKSKVLEFIHLNVRDWFDTRDVAALMQKPHGTIRAYIFELFREGYLERENRTKKHAGKNYVYRATGAKPVKIEAPNPSIRPYGENLYQAIIRIGHDEDFEPLPAELPTGALPGSDEKIAIMRRRIELGQAIHHDLDARCYKIAGEDHNSKTVGIGYGGIREFSITKLRMGH